MKDYQRMRIKDLCELLDCSHGKAVKVMKDLKEEFNTKDVLFCHFKAYFNVPAM